MTPDEHTTPRINASLLSNYHGRTVCLLGMGKNVDGSGKFFTLTTSDNKDVKIIMDEPLSERLSGLTEVCGTVVSNSTVQGSEVITFSEEATQSFDMSLYQKAVELTQRRSDLYIVGGAKED